MSFRDALRQVAHSRDFDAARCTRVLSSGRAPRTVLRKFALRTYVNAVSGTLILHRLIGATDDTRCKHFLMELLVEEEGGVVCDGRLAFVGDALHSEWARQFARATGCTDAVIDHAHTQAKVFPSLESTLATDGWLAATAEYLCGIEAVVPQICSATLRALAPYGFDPTALRFFVNHLVADVEHGNRGADLVDSVCKTATAQAAVLAAVQRGVDTMWRAYDGVVTTSAPSSVSSRGVRTAGAIVA